MYDFAIEQFSKATDLEPCLPLAHVFGSLAHAKALWNNIDWDKGRKAIKAFPGNCSASSSLTPTEAGYAAAAQALWSGSGNSSAVWAENVAAFTDKLESEYTSRPTADVAAWVGLANLATSASNGTAALGHNGGKGAAHGAKSTGPAGNVVRAREVLEKWAKTEQ